MVPSTAVAPPPASANIPPTNTPDNLQQLGAVVGGGTDDAERRVGLPAAATPRDSRRGVPTAAVDTARDARSAVGGGGGDSQHVVDQVNKAT